MKLHHLMIVAGIATCFAQGPGMPPPGGVGPRTPNFDSLKTYLSLSDTQVEGLRQIQTQQQSTMQSLRQEMATKQKALQDQLKAGSTDAAAVGRLVLDLEALRKKAQDAGKGLTTQATNILTPDQKTKLTALDEAANLRDEIRQATALHLLVPAEIPGGPGFMGRGMGGAPEGRPGQGPMMFGRRPGAR
ncbi:MAG: periplasmic heavy metal sensor [Acidobacteriia bacterium]|nr:periplasmic heavy metal sensor [Terriglobia bacterium]